MVSHKISKKILDKTIELELFEEKTYGIFLSGGIDSLALLHWISKEAPFVLDRMYVYTILKESTQFAKQICSLYNLSKRHTFVPAGGPKEAAAKVINNEKHIDQFLAGVTALPPVQLRFDGPEAIRNDSESDKIQLPFLKLDKRYSIKLALDIGAPIELTHTCTQYVETHCGRCFMCVERKWAFAKLGYSDVAEFETSE